jgi:exonuclease SbcD
VKVVHLADLHLKLTGPRAEECRRVLDWLADDIHDLGPEYVVIAGDIFDRRSTPEERLYFRDWILRVSARSRVLAIPGNHDDPQDLELFDDIPGTLNVDVAPRVAHWPDASFAVLPWPRLGHLAASLPAGVGIAERREAARAALVDVLRGMRSAVEDARAAGTPTLLLAHANVIGAAMDSGQPVCGGEEIALTADELLECGADGVALGHIHARQQMRAPKPVWYAGAPYRATFGEARGGKGYLLWTWTPEGWAVEPRDGPARRMVLAEAELGDSSLEWSAYPDDDEVRDAEVRLRVAFSSDRREEARDRASDARQCLLTSGARSVTVEERPLITQRTRCAEIQAARGSLDKLRAWATATGQEVPTTAETKVGQLEEAAP